MRKLLLLGILILAGGCAGNGFIVKDTKREVVRWEERERYLSSWKSYGWSCRYVDPYRTEDGDLYVIYDCKLIR